MKFLCVPCNEPMKLQETRPADRGSLTIVYACEACGYEMAMLTNAMETQLVQSLGVRIGPGQKEGSGCPFAATLPPTPRPAASGDGPAWTAEAEQRLANVPEFVRPMARSGIESFARERGYATIDARVMDEARGHFGM
jgi:Proto-chlorophyllide reductase 57 kD subunit